MTDGSGMKLTKRNASAALAVCVGLLLAGCGSAPEKATTVDAPAATSTSEPDETASSEPVVEAVSLSQEQIDAALLTQAEAPAGWTVTTGEGSDDEAEDAGAAEEDLSVYAPAECKDIAGVEVGEADKEANAEGAVAFANADYQFVAENIATWDGSLRAGELDRFAAELSKCANYTVTDPDGTVTTFTMSALDVPNYGERTFAVRLAAQGDASALNIGMTLDVVIIASGHTSVSLVAGGFKALDPAVVQQFAAAAAAKVDAAA